MSNLTTDIKCHKNSTAYPYFNGIRLAWIPARNTTRALLELAFFIRPHSQFHCKYDRSIADSIRFLTDICCKYCQQQQPATMIKGAKLAKVNNDWERPTAARRRPRATAESFLRLYVSNASRQTSTEVDNFSLPVVAVISEDVAQVGPYAVQL